MAQTFTVKGIEKLTEPGRYRDAEVKGLYLQIKKNEETGAIRRSWILRYQVGGKERQLGLGPLHLVGPKEARERARAARMKLLDGIDPLAEKNAKKAAQQKAEAELTFEQAARQWHGDNASKWGSPKALAQVLQTLEDYAFPMIGQMPVKDIDTPDVLRVITPIWRTIPVTASRVRGRIEAVLAWATVHGHRKGDNPAKWRGHLKEALPPHQSVAKVQHHEALPYQDAPAFMAELGKLEGVAPRALEFLILTAGRSGEVRGAKWDEIDFDQRLWTIPAERMKAGQAHSVPLTDAAIELLNALPREEGNPFLFVGFKRGQAIGVRAMTCVLEDMGRKGLTVHGFRSTFRDWAGDETHHAHEVCEAALAHHVGSKVERAYRRGDALAKRRALMQDWSDYCAGKTRGGNVVAFAR